jgi:putative flippase GtrA
MTLFTGVLGIPALPANALAVVVMSVANFVMADRWVFRAAPLALACVLLAPGAAGGTARGCPGGVGALRDGH